VLVAAGARQAAAQVQWTEGEGVVVGPSQNLTVDAAQPNIFCLTNNGTLAFVAGGSVSITGNVASAIGADGETGVMTIGSGAEVTITVGAPASAATGTFIVGF
jgi:hypothetical protein